MSVPFGPLVLTLDDITRHLRRTFEQFTDPRQGQNPATRWWTRGGAPSRCFSCKGLPWWHTRAAWSKPTGPVTPKRSLGAIQSPATIQFATCSTPPHRLR